MNISDIEKSVSSIYSSKQYKNKIRHSNEKANQLKIYRDNEYKISRRKVKPTTPYIQAFIKILEPNESDAIIFALSSAIMMIKSRDYSNPDVRVGRIEDWNSRSMKMLGKDVKDKYFEICEYINEKDEKLAGYRLKDVDAVSDIMNEYIKLLANTSYLRNRQGLPEGDNLSNYIYIEISEFKKSTLMAQYIHLSNIVAADDTYLYIMVRRSQAVANKCRQSNVWSRLPRADRGRIIYAEIDQASSLQTILTNLIKKLVNVDLPWNTNYIENKNMVRANVAELMDWSIEKTKMEITAISQGRWWSKKKYHNLKELFDERDAIQDVLMSLQQMEAQYKLRLPIDIQEAIEVATKMTQDKYLILDKNKRKVYRTIDGYRVVSRVHDLDNYKYISDNYKDGIAYKKLRNTFTFFFWTYFERMIQDIVTKESGFIHNLHDANITQDMSLATGMISEDIENIEKVILDSTGIPMKLKLSMSSRASELYGVI